MGVMSATTSLSTSKTATMASDESRVGIESVDMLSTTVDVMFSTRPAMLVTVDAELDADRDKYDVMLASTDSTLLVSDCSIGRLATSSRVDNTLSTVCDVTGCAVSAVSASLLHVLPLPE
jgi:hypothetical protein